MVFKIMQCECTKLFMQVRFPKHYSETVSKLLLVMLERASIDPSILYSLLFLTRPKLAKRRFSTR